MEFDTGEHSKSLSACESSRARSTSLLVTAANAGDHKPIYDFLRVANCAPTQADFFASLDEPTYEPTDRLLVKLDGQIIAHAQVLERVAWFLGSKLPVGGVESLATLPEIRDAGYERLLISAAEQTLRDAQCVLAFAHTDLSDSFRVADWCDIASPPCTESNVHEVLARLAAHPPDDSIAPRTRPLRIRRWRQVELDALLQVYRHAAASTWGAFDRNEAYWRWLVGRGLHDELIVAIDGRDDWDSLESLPHIVGYTIVRGSQIVELATLPDFRRAAAPLLARACQDAIERDLRTISLHLPTADPLHTVMLAAGGRWLQNSRSAGNTWMVKLLDPANWIESAYDVLLERAKAAELARPLAIRFDTGRRRYRLELTRRSSHFLRDDEMAPDVRCSPQVLGALLLGAIDVAATCEASQLVCNDPQIRAQLAALFPPMTFWQSPLDVT